MRANYAHDYNNPPPSNKNKHYFRWDEATQTYTNQSTSEQMQDNPVTHQDIQIILAELNELPPLRIHQWDFILKIIAFVAILSVFLTIPYIIMVINSLKGRSKLMGRDLSVGIILLFGGSVSSILLTIWVYLRVGRNYDDKRLKALHLLFDQLKATHLTHLKCSLDISTTGDLS